MKKYVPSLFTSANLTCGFLAILVGDLFISSWLLLLGIFFDSLDGFFARLLNAQSEIGKELDSLADMISFGLAPAYLYFFLSPMDHWLYYIPPIILVLGSALRLAIFNTIPDSKYFTGLPTPAVAFFLIGLYFSHHYESDLVLGFFNNDYIYFGIPIFFSYMMLGNLRMFTLKNVNKGIAENKFQAILFIIFLALLFIDFKIAIPVSVLLYIVMSVIYNIVKP